MKNSPAQPAAAALRTFAMTFPEVYEEFPWGETALKVKGKVFVFLRADADGLSFSVKLPQSGTKVLDKPYAAPTGYGLGKSGWVTCRFEAGDRVPTDEIEPWITESYRAVAPKTLVKQLDGGATAAPAKAAALRATKRTSPKPSKAAAKPTTKPAAKLAAKPVAKKRAATPARKR